MGYYLELGMSGLWDEFLQDDYLYHKQNDSVFESLIYKYDSDIRDPTIVINDAYTMLVPMLIGYFMDNEISVEDVCDKEGHNFTAYLIDESNKMFKDLGIYAFVEYGLRDKIECPTPETSFVDFYYDRYSGFDTSAFPDNAYSDMLFDSRFGQIADVRPSIDPDLTEEEQLAEWKHAWRRGHPVTDPRLTMADVAKQIYECGSCYAEPDENGDVVGISCNIDIYRVMEGVSEAFGIFPDDVCKGGKSLKSAIEEHERSKEGNEIAVP